MTLNAASQAQSRSRSRDPRLGGAQHPAGNNSTADSRLLQTKTLDAHISEQEQARAQNTYDDLVPLLPGAKPSSRKRR